MHSLVGQYIDRVLGVADLREVACSSFLNHQDTKNTKGRMPQGYSRLKGWKAASGEESP